MVEPARQPWHSGGEMKRAAITALVMSSAVACSSLSVSQDYRPGTDFTVLRTWSWMPEQGTTVNAPNNELVDERLVQAVETVMESRGYRQVPDTEADFHVGYHLIIEDQVDYQTVNEYWGSDWSYGMYGPRYGPTTGVVTSTSHEIEYSVGTLVIDFFDASERELMWRGVAQGTVRPQDNPVDRQRQADEAVRAILDQFPPEG